MIRKQYDIVVKEKRDDGGRILISTGTLDRDRDHVRPYGARVDNYMRNPVVQWGHNYRDPWATIGKTNELTVSDEGIVADFDLRPAANDNDPQSVVLLLWNGGWINTASIGFDPVREAIQPNDDGGRDYEAWELLEWSLVPIPANQEALRLAVKGLRYVDVENDFIKTVVPYADHGTDRGDWSAPTLSNFTSDPISELSASERRRIAAHYTWSANIPPEAFTDLKLPHHRGGRSGVGSAVWRGVAAAMAALLGARGGVDVPAGDRRGIYNHLSRHYAQFDAEAPEFRAYEVDELEALFPIEKDESIEPAPIQTDDKDGLQEPAPEPEPTSEPVAPETNNNANDELQSDVLDALGELVDALGGVLGVT